MPQSCAAVFVHLVFSTKNREPWIRAPVESELHAYGTTVLKNAGCPALAMNGTADHVHVLFNLSRVKTLAEVVEELKTSTSKWIKTKARGLEEFYWQAGYGAFSVSASKLDDVKSYILNQEEHHRQRSFCDEFRQICVRHGVEIDEKYVWG